jgi:hypothetical protein
VRGFVKFKSDLGIFGRGKGDAAVFIGLYVDDMLVMGKDRVEVKGVKEMLKRYFKMEDLGEAKYVLGMELKRLANGDLKLCQTVYAKGVVNTFGMEGCKSVVSPLDPGKVLSKALEAKTEKEIREMERVPYRSAIGSLMYLMTGTRPDLGAAMSQLSKYCQNPGKGHWEAVKRVLRYVAGTLEYGLVFKRGCEISVGGFCDSDYGGNVDTGRSTTGYVFMLGGTAISWGSVQQPTVALSTAEAEYMGACSAAKHAVWEQELFGELGWVQRPIRIGTDSTSSLALMVKPGSFKRTKHIRIQWHYVRERVEEGDVEFYFVGTKDQGADMMTKAVGGKVLENCRKIAGLGE